MDFSQHGQAGRKHEDDAPLSPLNLAELIAREEAEAADVLHLTANETVLSPLAQRVLSSPLSERYLLEHLDMREASPARLNNLLLRGLDRISEIERSATEVCRELFGSRFAEFRCLSGPHAMQTTFAALTEPGDNVMRVATRDGGNTLTELVCRSFGRQSRTYVFDDDMSLDIDRTREAVKKERPSLLYVDALNHLFPFPLGDLKEIAGETPLVFDASHTLGLIAGGRFQDPLAEGADILQADTHATLFGPQKGIVLGNDRVLMENVGYTLSSAMVGSQHTAPTLALFLALHEIRQEGERYADRVVENARYLAERLHERGVRVVAADRGFTANHMFFVDTRDLGSGPEILDRLVRADISANRVVAFRHRDTLRFGVQEITRRGFGRPELDEIAGLLAPLLLGRTEPEHVRPRVRAHQRIHYTGTGTATGTATGTDADAAPREPRASVRLAQAPPPRPRWIGIHLTPSGTGPRRATYLRARELGALAGDFPHQIDAAGSISCTGDDGLTFVTGSGASIKDLAPDDFVEITGRDGWTLRCRGEGPPSAEAYLHQLLRETVGARYVVHNHCIPGRQLEEEGTLVLPPREYGSVALAEAVAEGARRSQVMYVRRRGLVFWSPEFDECRELVRKFGIRTLRRR